MHFKKDKKCSYRERVHEIKRKKCPAFGKTCTNCLKKHFQAVCKFKKKNVERVEENEINMEIFSVKNKNKEIEKIEQKKKDIILKVKINNFDLDMQMDTGSEVTLIPKIFWEHIGKKANFMKKQFATPPISRVGQKNFWVL